MVHRRWFGLPASCIGLAMLAAAARAAALPAPAVFATSDYGLTFRTPLASTYCPLPKDWIGSDHGTILFLRPPQTCGGAGYPSIARAFAPENTPRIEVYYQYWMAEDEPRRRCNLVGRIRLLGRLHSLCASSPGHGVVVVEVQGRYRADVEAEAAVILLTTRRRYRRDLRSFEALTRTVRPCSAEWRDPRGRRFTVGTGGPCPADGKYF